MAYRTGNVVVSFMDVDDEPVPMFTDFNVSTHGYRSPDSPFRHAPGRIKSSVTIDKSIGCVFWKEGSAVEFGGIDIAIEDGGRDLVNGTMIDWVTWAKDSPTPQVVIAVELSDGTLEHVATADGSDIQFPDDRTIRVRLDTKHSQKLDAYLNQYYSGVSDELDGTPIPIYWGSGAVIKPIPTVLRDDTALRYDVTDLDILQGVSPSPYRVYDQGVVLLEGDSPGFNIVDNGFELTANPAGKITFTWSSLDGGGVEDPLETGEMLEGTWRILRYVLFRAGIDVDTYYPYPTEGDFPIDQLGSEARRFPMIHHLTEVSARQILDQVMNCIGGYWYVDELGLFQFGQIVAPEDQAIAAQYTDTEMVGTISAHVDLAPGLSTRVAFGPRPGYYQQSEIAGSVVDPTRSTISLPWSYLETGEAIPSLYAPAAGHPPIEILNTGTGLSVHGYVQDELDRWWADLYYTTRRFYTFQIPLYGSAPLPQLGESNLIQSDLFRLIELAVAVLVRRVKLDLGSGLVQLEGWGGEYSSELPAPTALTAEQDTETSIDLEWVE